MKDYSVAFKYIEQETGLKIEPEYKFHPTRRWRFDFAIPSEMIAIEIEGGLWLNGRHNRPLTMIKDFEKYNSAAKLGWRILKYTPSQVNTPNIIINDIKECTKS